MSSNVVEQYRIQIGNQLRMARVSQGWTYEQVATMAGFKAQTVEKVEAGAFNVPFDVLARVADVLGCSVVIKQREEWDESPLLQGTGDYDTDVRTVLGLNDN